MLIKEYRILLPLTVDEYRIAQLYMIQKKSSQESTGADSGVEIVINQPYVDGPGGSGQYTFKVYHVGSHTPAWFRSILPKAALQVEEEAWNAYPYTKTRYTCPFVEKFLLEVETVYFNDAGGRDNALGLSEAELRERVVDVIDIVNDPVPFHDYCPEEDPKLFVSAKTGRGPLSDDWVRGCSRPDSPLPIMCAYKVCRVEFRYWGMQTKAEKFIHDVALRRTMVRAHRQAWAWQDEWHGLSMDDIRQLEKRAQELLNRKMAKALGGEEKADEAEGESVDSLKPTGGAGVNGAATGGPSRSPSPAAAAAHSSSSCRSLKTLTSLDGLKQVDHLSAIRADSLSDADEYYDAADEISEETAQSRLHLARCSSTDLATIDEGKGVESEAALSLDADFVGQPKTNFLVMLFHGGALFDTSDSDQSKLNDLVTLRLAFDTVMKSHYQNLAGRIAFRLVPCPNISNEASQLVRSLCPRLARQDESVCCQNMPLTLIPLLSCYSKAHSATVDKIVILANQIFAEFLASEEGGNFCGDVCLIGDFFGGLLAYDSLLRRPPRRLSRNISEISSHSAAVDDISGSAPHGQLPQQGCVGGKERKRTVQSDDAESDLVDHLSGQTFISEADEDAFSLTPDEQCLSFQVAHLYLLGVPLGLLLAFRKVLHGSLTGAKPHCGQVYNLFYRLDPCSARLEPLLADAPAPIGAADVSRYQRHPLGDGKCALWSTYYSNCDARDRASNDHSDVGAEFWGPRRVDYALFYPEGLSTLPGSALPAILHSSYWESLDLAAFIIRQMLVDSIVESDRLIVEIGNAPIFAPENPTERWLRRTTSFKVKNMTANHRANDVVVLENQPQIFQARFAYGLLDVVSLRGEKVNVYVQESGGSWTLYGGATTDGAGRLTFRLDADGRRRLPRGVYAVKMVVAGDHTALGARLVVVAAGTPCAVFSIDGSLTASVSVSARDPKVRPGAVDVVRHWQDRGLLIIYVTARPCMQQRRVVSWLTQHNFPLGVLFFTDGFLISTDPLRQKTAFLKRLAQREQMRILAAYGSTKDVHVYREAGVSKDNIYVIGRASKKWHDQATILSDGYSAHLNALRLQLTNGAESRPALLNGSFGSGVRGFMSFSSRVQSRQRAVGVQRTRSFTPHGVKRDDPNAGHSPSLAVPAPISSGTKRFSFKNKGGRSVSPLRIFGLTNSKAKKDDKQS